MHLSDCYRRAITSRRSDDTSYSSHQKQMAECFAAVNLPHKTAPIHVVALEQTHATGKPSDHNRGPFHFDPSRCLYSRTLRRSIISRHNSYRPHPVSRFPSSDFVLAKSLRCFRMTTLARSHALSRGIDYGEWIRGPFPRKISPRFPRSRPR